MENFHWNLQPKAKDLHLRNQGISSVTLPHNDAMEKCKNKQNNNNDLMRA